MLVNRTTANIIKLTIASEVTIAVGDVIGISSEEAVLADKDLEISAVGLAKSVQGSIVYIQTNGKFANTDAGENYWLGTSGSLVNTVPTSGMVQQIGKRADNQNILIDIDKSVIIL